ncbi:hypothetical protein F3Y22_tig00110998pilonHSYRG00071 [Hibiscus syriacus]|uniref:Uncharacterized protein n=1 Tax=Hibiscus syriacus TaxID=106335 RepID=A0A6A2Z8G5_HIBSY|nr:hypothetical protein F3Y22_tig00110998pilonHSYRG00071 [Hibiscus syriacus]
MWLGKGKKEQLEQQQILNLVGSGESSMEAERVLMMELDELKSAKSVYYLQRDKIGTADEGVQGCDIRILRDLLDFSLPDEAGKSLIKEVTKDEIRSAFFSRGRTKALVIIKILVARLTPFFPGMIPMNQSAIVKGFPSPLIATWLDMRGRKGIRQGPFIPLFVRVINECVELRFNATKTIMFSSSMNEAQLELVHEATRFKMGTIFLRCRILRIREERMDKRVEIDQIVKAMKKIANIDFVPTSSASPAPPVPRMLIPKELRSLGAPEFNGEEYEDRLGMVDKHDDVYVARASEMAVLSRGVQKQVYQGAVHEIGVIEERFTPFSLKPPAGESPVIGQLLCSGADTAVDHRECFNGVGRLRRGSVVAFIATTVFSLDQSKGGSFGESPNYGGDSPLEKQRVWLRGGSEDFGEVGIIAAAALAAAGWTIWQWRRWHCRCVAARNLGGGDWELGFRNPSSLMDGPEVLSSCTVGLIDGHEVLSSCTVGLMDGPEVLSSCTVGLIDDPKVLKTSCTVGLKDVGNSLLSKKL